MALEPMLCPECHAKMNHHADKVKEPCDREEQRHCSATLLGVLEQFFACPLCGFVAARVAS